MNPHETVAIFGGTFDPPHLGHQDVIEELILRDGFKEVWVVPSANPPHKSGLVVTDPFSRTAMAKLLCESAAQKARVSPERIRMDAREIKRGAPAQPSYAWDTLQEMRSEGARHLCFVIGTDQLAHLPRWHRFPEVLQLCHWLVLERKDDPLQEEARRVWTELQHSPHTKKTGMTIRSTDARALSSQQIREALAKNQAPLPLESVPTAVAEWIRSQKLYGHA